MPEYDYEAILSTMRRAARAVGVLTRKATPEKKINIGVPGDIVTIVDLEADNLIKLIIEKDFPDLTIVSEEASKKDSEYKSMDLSDFTGFLVDPIDGSVNFSRIISPNYANYAVSIGYAENGTILAGVIYKPHEDEMFHAVRGQGAFQDDRLIHVSEVNNINHAAIEVGSFWIREEMELFQRWFTRKETDVEQILIRGSAAAGLADVARGRVEAMLHSRLNAWDYAAGWVIVEEAGGITMDGDCSPLKLGSRFIYATNKNLNEVIVRILNEKA